MKSTGMVRRLDILGRIVLPVEIRRTLGIEEKDPLEIYVDEDRIVLRKYIRGCNVCGACDNLTTYSNITLCGKCLKKFKTEDGK